MICLERLYKRESKCWITVRRKMSKDKELSQLDKEFIEDTMKATGNLDMPIKG